ncbi:MAG: N-6 DNA methylase [Bernardetiaceae bacterium]|nr:N-6 DNA methylase [Bernardetiaceae bacterium]
MNLEVLENIGYTQENGLVICSDEAETEHISEWYHIFDKAKRLEVDAVLFRRYFDAENTHINSKPSVYIFQRDDNFFNTQAHKDLHAKIWSSGEIDIYIIVGTTRIDIINARRPADITEKEEDLDLENLKLFSNTIQAFNDQRFSAHIFGKGMFWEQKEFENKENKDFYPNKLDEKNAPFHRLLDYLKDTRKTLKEEKQKDKLSDETIDRLLITCILIKYLEGIEDDKGKNTLAEIYQNAKITKFEQALENGKTILDIFQNLASEFNGKIFDIFTKAQKQEILEKDLSLIAQFLTGKIDTKTKQLFIWEQYNFNFLPIELISSIYESFLPKSKGVVYTPPFLVDFLVDEVMPLDKATTYFANHTFKVLDPSCGSGVFLVSAYKRMLEWWSVNHYKETGEVQFPDKNTCQKILETNIFGVDIQGTATLISIFSLTIALLDKLSPKEIWNGLKFKDLSKNIRKQNFFEWAVNAPKDFELAIGNPPFNFEDGKKLKDYIYIENEDGIVDLTKGFKHKKVARNNFAIHFFEGAMTLARKSCLIIPSNVLLYDKAKETQKYRTQIFTDFTVKSIFDFTAPRRILFGNAEVPVCAVISENKPSKHQLIEHTVIKRTEKLEKKEGLEIDYYDKHFVSWQWATDENKQFIWKCNLLGGGRLFQLIYRLSLLETLGNFLEKKKDWGYNIGYIIKHSNKKRIKANFIYNQNTIKPKSFNEDGSFQKIKEAEKTFVETRTKELYEAPHIIFKLIVEENKIPMAFVEEYLCFNSSFVGISAPEKDKNELYQIYERLHKNEVFSNLYRAFILATSSKAVVYHETSMVKADIDSLPYPQNIEYLKVFRNEDLIIKDVLNYYRHLGKATDEDGKALHQIVTESQLQNYGQIFCETLNEEHDHAEEDRLWHIGAVLKIEEFVAYQFLFGKEQEENNSFQIKEAQWRNIEKLIFNTEENRSAVFTRILRYYGSNETHDFVWLIKPNTNRYWLNSIALRDADDTFKDYFEVGY